MQMLVSTMMCVRFGYRGFVVAWRVAGEACSCSHLQTFLHHLQKGKCFKVGILIVRLLHRTFVKVYVGRYGN